MSMPRCLPEGIVNSDLLSHYDFLPTILQFTGIEYPGIDEIPGRSFTEILDGIDSINQTPIMVYDEYGQTRMIRNKKHKYIHRYNGLPCEFYDLIADPKETINGINNPDFAKPIKDLRTELTEWFDRYTNPEHDGSKQLVKGRGQLDIIQSEGESFAQDVTFLSK